ncbi:MAG: DnaB-like helicase C-terminal domain-containing protein, partial [bacterium]
YAYAVSVPDGAPPARDGFGNLIDVPEGVDDIDPANDEKYRYIANNWDRLKKIKRIVIATDADEPGRRLAAELVRRLGRVRCSFVSYPEGCKDLNEVLIGYGAAEVNRIIGSALPYPVSGVYAYHDLPQEPELCPKTTGWDKLDEYLMLYHPALMVVTGFAGQGKTSWTQQLVSNLARIHGWTTAIASFEMRIKPYVTNAIGTAMLGIASKRWGDGDQATVDEFLDRNFCFIAPEPDCERVHDVSWLLEKAEVAVIRHGARVLLIDPWNEIEHSRDARESTTEYVNRALREIKDFGRRFDVLVIIVAHPTKGATSKSPEEVTLYDIADSAAFQNKADLGVVVARLGDPAVDIETGIFVKKVRYQPSTGKIGSIELVFDRETGMFM